MQRDHHIRIQGEDGHLQARERGLKGSQPCGSLTLDPWPLELWESMGLLFKPLSLYFIVAAPADLINTAT